MNPYETLGINKNASDEEVKQAYYNLSKQVRMAEKFNISIDTIKKILRNNDIQYYYDYK